ncbi:DUF3224 domain-containing protein [Deinococcus radiopugnans]|uniref:DUF3224 domain-containing protein n=1 Tax=Deinococcus radiopugnans ATCC 19172 TaxID=585398 RepID=A0A5C4Y5H4_9DEIO|nr:DUF3224 domain-containing protein [Deinococcus radiopugnans]MBB6017198.1 hypothetical protein [Deinococcus radiopugnans ATCC 19172]TNM70516.1 DUF3224 domain-containing protein [Deinococcus radiopugnans ATCC 19172]
MNASGTFTVQPRADAPAQTVPDIGRMVLDKRWSGELDGHSVVEMLTCMTPVAGSAVYVAIETVQAVLNGRQGSFAFFHTGVSERGRQRLTYRVVPDSGSGGLAGLSGELTLNVVEGVHHYTLDYTLPET